MKKVISSSVIAAIIVEQFVRSFPYPLSVEERISLIKRDTTEIIAYFNVAMLANTFLGKSDESFWAAFKLSLISSFAFSTAVSMYNRYNSDEHGVPKDFWNKFQKH